MSEDWASIEFHQRHAEAAERMAETMKEIADSLNNIGQASLKMNDYLARIVEQINPEERGFADE